MILHTLKEPWLINSTSQIIFNMIIKTLGFTKINDKNLPVY